MTRRNSVKIIGGAIAVCAALPAKEENTMRELLEASQSEKKSVMIYLRGQTIGGGVVKLSGDTVELRNREYSRIVVRLDAIEAVAML